MNKKPLPQPSEIVHDFLLEYELKYGPSLIDAYAEYLNENGIHFNEDKYKLERNLTEEEIATAGLNYNNALEDYTPEEVRDFLLNYFKSEKEKENNELINEMKNRWNRSCYYGKK